MLDIKTLDIKRAMSDLGRRLAKNDNSQLLHWVIPEKLACAHRPLRHHPLYGGSGKNLSLSATSLVFDWAEEVQIIGVRGIICLMHDRDLRYYGSLNLGTANLLEFYKKVGFEVSHIPWEDPHHKKSSGAEKEKSLLKVRELALAAYDDLPKPVLIQCSAGIDRSSPVAAFIWAKRVQ
jgi:hypothetical protein